MDCPRDGGILETRSFGETSLPMCPVCGGMFLKHGELNRIAGPSSGDLEFCTVDLDSFQHEDEYGPIECPFDSTPMGKVNFNIETNIILDYWMDGKELERITEEAKRLKEADQEVPDPPLVRISQFFWKLLPH
jgi:Zn-finger nucleic acid-binding protein